MFLVFFQVSFAYLQKCLPSYTFTYWALHSFFFPSINPLSILIHSPFHRSSHPPGICSRKLERFSAVLEPERGGGWDKEWVRESSERRESREEPGEPLSLKEHMELTESVTISGPPCSLGRLSEREHWKTGSKVTTLLTRGTGWGRRNNTCCKGESTTTGGKWP